MVDHPVTSSPLNWESHTFSLPYLLYQQTSKLSLKSRMENFQAAVHMCPSGEIYDDLIILSDVTSVTVLYFCTFGQKNNLQRPNHLPDIRSVKLPTL